ncbi:MAG: thiolase domain-containing protein [Candidatus Aenigmarchaeota archaeon]|nr:thiolase domain-containing protein [Candidatus Aenigmarchaeota archaeon]
MNDVAVVGVGQTKFGELWEKSLRNISIEAALLALQDANLSVDDVSSLYIGNMSSGSFTGQDHLAALIADQLGITPRPAVKCEAACASGSLAFRQAYMGIQSGMYDAALVLGAEKMTDVKGENAVKVLMGAGDHEWESSIGLTFAGAYALIARRHMELFGTTREQLAMVSVNNHKNASNNPYAHFSSQIKIGDVLKAPMIAEPLGLLDCSPISDGAAAVILVNDKLARRFENPIWVAGTGHGTDTVALHDRRSLVEMMATKQAAKQAYDMSGLRPDNIDVVEVHDCFSINEVIAVEDLGFCNKGDGGKFVEDGGIGIDGERPVNTTGGLKAIGHPVGATGVRQIVDVVRQLRGDSFNQIASNHGLTLNIGGSGATSIVNIFTKELKR